nr:MAG TPA: DNA-directed RNA polymerase subunit [Caudoviricetes sp.]
MSQSKLDEKRCKECNQLLFKASDKSNAVIQIKCHRCKCMNSVVMHNERRFTGRV